MSAHHGQEHVSHAVDARIQQLPSTLKSGDTQTRIAAAQDLCMACPQTLLRCFPDILQHLLEAWLLTLLPAHSLNARDDASAHAFFAALVNIMFAIQQHLDTRGADIHSLRQKFGDGQFR